MRPHPLALAVNELDTIDRTRWPALRRQAVAPPLAPCWISCNGWIGSKPNACAAICRRTLAPHPGPRPAPAPPPEGSMTPALNYPGAWALRCATLRLHGRRPYSPAPAQTPRRAAIGPLQRAYRSLPGGAAITLSSAPQTDLRSAQRITLARRYLPALAAHRTTLERSNA
jgi:hypothetical protein